MQRPVRSSVRHGALALLIVGALGALAAPPAGATARVRVGGKNLAFCDAIGDTPTNFEELDRSTAKRGAAAFKAAAKTGVPPKVKKALKKIARYYRRVAGGENPEQIFAQEGLPISNLYNRFNKYYAQNCRAPT